MKTTHLFLLFSFILLTACSENTEEKNDEHIWQHQTDALKDAQQLQQKVNQDNERKQKQMDELQE